MKLPKNIRKCLSFTIIHIFSTHFAIRLFYLPNLKTNYETTTPPCMWTNEIKTKQNRVTSHSKWLCVLLFDLAHHQCKGIIKGWFHCLTSESKGRFLVKNIRLSQYVVWSWCKSNFLWLKNKDWTLRTLALPLPPPPPPSLSVDVLCVSITPLEDSSVYKYILPSIILQIVSKICTQQ